MRRARRYTESEPCTISSRTRNLQRGRTAAEENRNKASPSHEDAQETVGERTDACVRAWVARGKGGWVYSPELADSVVTVVDSLAALLAHDTHPDVRRLDHRHVIGACTAAGAQ